MIEYAIMFVVFMLPITAVLIAVIIAFGQKPGFRRRCQHDFNGPERRCQYRKICPNNETCKIQFQNCPLNQVKKCDIIVVHHHFKGMPNETSNDNFQSPNRS